MSLGAEYGSALADIERARRVVDAIRLYGIRLQSPTLIYIGRRLSAISEELGEIPQLLTLEAVGEPADEEA